jgi:hypothetical protein
LLTILVLPDDDLVATKRRPRGEIRMQSGDPSLLTSVERRSELAVIFAEGLLRLRDRASILVDGAGHDFLLYSAVECLEVSAETVLSVVHGG